MCHGCSLLYENPRYSEDIIISGYQASQESGHDSQFALRSESFLEALRGIQKHIPEPGALVLDIGSAGGAFLEAAKAFGYDAIGLEPSRDLVEHARNRGLNVQEGTIDTHKFEERTFDMVCFWDVLEHVVDPVAALASARKLLKKDGILLVNYPDIGTWQAKMTGRRFWWILSCHLTHFSPPTIREAYRRAGLKVFLFKPYRQALEIGYLFKIAAHLGVPFAGFVGRLLPQAIAKMKLRYWASQTTALAKIDSDILGKGTAS
jgi:SAM-dependent methyltransferase